MQSSVENSQRPLVHLWWLHPMCIFSVVLISTLLMAIALSPSAYLEYGTPKYIQGWHLALGAMALAAFGVGSAIGARAAGNTPAANEPTLSIHWLFAAAGLTMMGYGVWYAIGAMRGGFNPGLIVQMLTNENEELSSILKFDVFTTIPGITTCTQFGVVAAMLVVLFFEQGKRWVWLIAAALIPLTLFRAVMLSERLALIEIVAPAIVLAVRIYLLGKNVSPQTRRAATVFPLLGVVSLVFLFGAAESVRSWPFYKDRFDSLQEFTLWRLSGYYTTAHNNGALALEQRPDVPIPYHTLESFWKFPLVVKSPFNYEALTGVDPDTQFTDTLRRYGTEELNNPGGLFLPVADFGIAGAVVFWILYGVLAGWSYRSFLLGNTTGLLMYPIVHLSLLEVPRLLYLCSVRAFPAIALIALIGWYQHQRGLEAQARTETSRYGKSLSTAGGVS